MAGSPEITADKDLSSPPPALADLLVEHLEQIGVEYVFGVPGGAIEPLYNALARSSRRGGPRPIVARHESGAAFMADGYARETGKLGVCCSTTGPGATNLITGVASAYADNVPMLVLTAQTALPRFGKMALQESSCTAVNTVAMFQSCTRYSSLVSHRGQLRGKLVSAISATQGPPAGPAHLSIPMDVLGSPRRLRPGDPPLDLDTLIRPPALIDIEALDKLWAELGQAKRIVLLLGDGCGEAIEHILEFAELLNAPILTCPSGKRWVNPDHPQYLGVLGFGGHSSACNCLHDDGVDLILAAGSRFSEMDFGDWEREASLNRKLIHIDEAIEHFTRSPLARFHVCGTLKAIFKTLVARVKQAPGSSPSLLGKAPHPPSLKAVVSQGGQAFPPPQISVEDPQKCFSDASPIKPQRLMRELSLRCPQQTRFCIDAGNSWAWATHYLHPRSRGLYRVAMGFGSMGWGIGAAVGTALGCPGSPVLCLTGDGSYLMSGQELTVAVAEKLPVIFVLLKDSALGMVKHGQRLGGGEPVAFELPEVDFVQVALAMGAQAEAIRSVNDLAGLDFDAICKRQGPTLLEVHIDSEEVPPMAARMKTLGR